MLGRDVYHELVGSHGIRESTQERVANAHVGVAFMSTAYRNVT